MELDATQPLTPAHPVPTLAPAACKKRDRRGRARPSREAAQALNWENKAARKVELEQRQRAEREAERAPLIAELKARKEAAEVKAACKHAEVDRFNVQRAAGEDVTHREPIVDRIAKSAARLDAAALKFARDVEKLQRDPKPQRPRCSLCGRVCGEGAPSRRCARCTAASDADPTLQPPKPKRIQCARCEATAKAELRRLLNASWMASPEGRGGVSHMTARAAALPSAFATAAEAAEEARLLEEERKAQERRAEAARLVQSCVRGMQVRARLEDARRQCELLDALTTIDSDDAEDGHGADDE